MALTPNQEQTNYKTFVHIEQVMRLLAAMQLELGRRMFTHDRSKLAAPELQMFEEVTKNLEGLTYGSAEYMAQLEAMKQTALPHHYAHNRHHPEHFPMGVSGMNLIDVLEMVCDWQAACMRHADGDIHKSLEINRDRFGLSDQLVDIIENTLPLLADPYEGLETQADL